MAGHGNKGVDCIRRGTFRSFVENVAPIGIVVFILLMFLAIGYIELGR